MGELENKFNNQPKKKVDKVLEKEQIQKPKLKKFIIILAAIFVLSFLVLQFSVLRPIKKSELIRVDKFNEVLNINEYCYEPSISLKKRCSFLGGEIRSVATGYGFGVVQLIGCFSKNSANDVGKLCKSNSNCQGYCVSDSLYYSGLCSKYKKPFFVFKEKITTGTAGLLMCNEKSL